MKPLIVMTVFLFFAIKSHSFDACVPIITEDKKVFDYNYIVAKGIFNEFLFYYMSFYKIHLKKLGVPDSQIKVVSNYSADTPLNSAKKIKKTIESFNNDRKVIILSHSKGALESLYMLIKFKEVRKLVHKSVLLQGPFQGVSSYDLTYGKIGDEVASKSWSFAFYRAVAKTAFISKRFKNFSKEVVLELFNHKLLEEEDLLKDLLFVRTYKNLEEINWRMQYLGGLYTNVLKVKSDGVIAYNEQLPKGVNTENSCVLEFYADHGDFAKTSFLGSSKRKKKIRSYLNHVLFGKEILAEFKNFKVSN